MSDKVVAGADFNGSKENPNETWLVVGRLSNLGLEILDVKKTGTHLLTKDLAVHKTLSAMGVDCPFSLPQSFLDFLAREKTKAGYNSWQEIVEELVFLPFQEFAALAKKFGKEAKRFTDTTGDTTVVSPLKRSNPPMQELTYHGMRVLASLDPQRFFVQPFQDPIPFGCAVMEVFPPDTLKYLGIKSEVTAKEKTDETLAETRREKLVSDLMKIKEKKALSFKDFPPLIIQKHFLHNFIKSDHAIDALVACYTIGMHSHAPAHFDDPFSADAMEVLLEGWIYRAK